MPETQGLSLTPEPGSFPGGGNGNPLQYSCLENSKSQTQLSKSLKSIFSTE